MTDLSELKAMVREVQFEINNRDVSYPHVMSSSNRLANAVLDYIKSQEPVKERDDMDEIRQRIEALERVAFPMRDQGQQFVPADVLLRGFDKIKHGPNNYEPADVAEAQTEIDKARQQGTMTSLEALKKQLSPADKPEEKAGREWWIVTLGARNNPAAFHTIEEASKFFDNNWQTAMAGRPIRVREVKE